MANPVEEFLAQAGLEKEAAPSFGRVGKAVGDAALAAGAGALATGAVGALAAAAGKLHDAATHGRDFRQMLDYNPDLEEHRSRDPRLFNQHYTSLRNMNPHFAADPIVAGTFMRTMSESPMNAGNVLRDAMSGRDKMPSLLGSMGEQAQSGARDSLKGALKGGPPGAPHGAPGWDRSDD